jgi:hypothetical protein
MTLVEYGGRLLCGLTDFLIWMIVWVQKEGILVWQTRASSQVVPSAPWQRHINTVIVS